MSTVWIRSLIRVERGYDVCCFFFITRLQRYCTTIFIWKIVSKTFMWIFYAFFVHILCILSIIKGQYRWYTGCYSFYEFLHFLHFWILLFIRFLWIFYAFYQLSRESTVGTLTTTVFREIGIWFLSMCF